MKIKILTLFPNMFQEFKSESIIKRAIEKGIVSIDTIDIREYSHLKHKHVDDTPCGGGAGMVLKVDIIDRAIKANSNENSYKIMMTPQGRPYSQKIANELSSHDELVFICGHYEGFDERIRSYVDDEISIGDYVLTGGELPAMVVCDSVIRLLNDAIKEESHEDDSFSTGLLEYPQYTRPEVYDGKRVPDVLLSGHHANIKKYRHEESLKRTAMYRPDLLENLNLNKEDQKVVDSVLKIEK